MSLIAYVFIQDQMRRSVAGALATDPVVPKRRGDPWWPRALRSMPRHG